ncbi:MAG: methionyl-tRNA formyltransferase [Bacteroidetes bacterium]|nr:methionyl-tRNA formyltransferase [Bacteroidota bacterium]
MGTPDFAVAPLQALVEAGWNVVGVVTAPDKPSGRGLQLQPSPVKKYALEHALPLLQPTNLKDPTFQQELAEWQAELQVVVAFRMLPEAVWNMPPLGSINLHASLLPAYRGAAPIHRAVMNGETETGLTTFFLRHAIDTGDLLDQVRLAIGPEETTGELHDRMMVLGAELVLSSVEKISKGQVNGQPQPPGENYPTAPKIFRDDTQIDWNRPAADLHNLVRGLSPSPAAWTTWQGKTLKIYRTRLVPEHLPKLPASPQGIFLTEATKSSQRLTGSIDEHILLNAEPGACYVCGHQAWMKCADQWLEILELQPEGRKRMPVSAWIQGLRA